MERIFLKKQRHFENPTADMINRENLKAYTLSSSTWKKNISILLHSTNH